jgi:hypothetical protein
MSKFRLPVYGFLLLLMLSLAYLNDQGTVLPRIETPVFKGTTHLRVDTTGHTLATLSAETELIVRGQVVRAESRWADDARIIVTDVEIAPLYFLRGQTTGALHLTVEGGVLADENVGMVSSNGVTFAAGEHVLLFLRSGLEAASADAQAGTTYVLPADAEGKYVVAGDTIFHGLLEQPQELTQFYDDLFDAAGDSVTLPAEWHAMEEAAAPVLPAGASDFVFNNVRWPGDYPIVDFYVNNSSTQTGASDGSAEDFLNAIIEAASIWNNVESAAFTFHYAGETDDTEVGFNGTNSVVFDPNVGDSLLGATRYWYSAQTGTILEVDVAFNDSADFDATGAQREHEFDLASVALHEFGHWLSLAHATDEGSVMHEALAPGKRRLTLGQSDIDGISAIYPCSELPCTAAVGASPEFTLLPSVPPGGTIPLNYTVEIPVDDDLAVALELTEDISVELLIAAESVDQQVRLAHSAGETVTTPVGYEFTGHSLQLHAYVDSMSVPDFALQRPALLTFHFGEADVVTDDHPLVLLRHDSADNSWVLPNTDPNCQGQTQLTGPDGRLDFSICVLGEYALFRSTETQTLQPERQIFLPIAVRQ